MLPPGKKIGSTVYESVEKAIRWPFNSKMAPSFNWARIALLNTGSSMSRVIRWEILPPLPWSKRILSVFICFSPLEF